MKWMIIHFHFRFRFVSFRFSCFFDFSTKQKKIQFSSSFIHNVHFFSGTKKNQMNNEKNFSHHNHHHCECECEWKSVKCCFLFHCHSFTHTHTHTMIIIAISFIILHNNHYYYHHLKLYFGTHFSFFSHFIHSKLYVCVYIVLQFPEC